MSQRGRLPQFGQWEKGNATYTMIFESARKDKNGEQIAVDQTDAEAMAAAAKADIPAPSRGPKPTVNPNDPEQNPQAFGDPAAALAQEHRDAKQGYHDRTSGIKDAPAPASSVKPISASGRKATVPKFGGWHETGHAPAEGYTVVFDKVKEKKQQTAHATLTAAPARNNEPETYHQRAGKTPSQPESFWTKLFGCFAPSAN